MGKDSPLKYRKKYINSRSNKFFEDESSIDNCTTETFYTGGSSKGKHFFFPTFNLTDEKFKIKNQSSSINGSRLPTPDKRENFVKTIKSVFTRRSKSSELLNKNKLEQKIIFKRNTAENANIKIVNIID